eukprot:m.610750 g.610750  ORF g.610750 m.610750 type:complete len:1327 (+) comp58132_c0_seq6:129-4109(+)
MQILISRNSELPPVPVTIDVDSHSLTAVLRRLDDLGVLPGQNIDRLYSEAGQLITKFDQIRENGHYVVTATSAPMLDNDATVDALADRARPRAPPKQRSREAILFPTKVNSSPGAAAVSPLPRMEDDESAHETVSPMPVIPKRHTDRLPRFARRHSAESLLLPPAIVDSTQEQTRPTAAKISPLKKRISLQDVFSEEERLREEILRRQDGRNSMVPPELEHPAFADVPASDSPRRSSSIKSSSSFNGTPIPAISRSSVSSSSSFNDKSTRSPRTIIPPIGSTRSSSSNSDFSRSPSVAQPSSSTASPALLAFGGPSDASSRSQSPTYSPIFAHPTTPGEGRRQNLIRPQVQAPLNPEQYPPARPMRPPSQGSIMKVFAPPDLDATPYAIDPAYSPFPTGGADTTPTTNSQSLRPFSSRSNSSQPRSSDDGNLSFGQTPIRQPSTASSQSRESPGMALRRSLSQARRSDDDSLLFSQASLEGMRTSSRQAQRALSLNGEPLASLLRSASSEARSSEVRSSDDGNLSFGHTPNRHLQVAHAQAHRESPGMALRRSLSQARQSDDDGVSLSHVPLDHRPPTQPSHRAYSLLNSDVSSPSSRPTSSYQRSSEDSTVSFTDSAMGSHPPSRQPPPADLSLREPADTSQRSPTVPVRSSDDGNLSFGQPLAEPAPPSRQAQRAYSLTNDVAAASNRPPSSHTRSSDDGNLSFGQVSHRQPMHSSPLGRDLPGTPLRPPTQPAGPFGTPPTSNLAPPYTPLRPTRMRSASNHTPLALQSQASPGSLASPTAHGPPDAFASPITPARPVAADFPHTPSTPANRYPRASVDPVTTPVTPDTLVPPAPPDMLSTPLTPAPSAPPDVPNTPATPASSVTPDIAPVTPASSLPPDLANIPVTPAPSVPPDLTPATPASSVPPDITPAIPATPETPGMSAPPGFPTTPATPASLVPPDIAPTTPAPAAPPDGPTTPSTPATPATPAPAAPPSIPSTPVTPATPASTAAFGTPATPATPATPNQNLLGKPKLLSLGSFSLLENLPSPRTPARPTTAAASAEAESPASALTPVQLKTPTESQRQLEPVFEVTTPPSSLPPPLTAEVFRPATASLLSSTARISAQQKLRNLSTPAAGELRPVLISSFDEENECFNYDNLYKEIIQSMTERDLQKKLTAEEIQSKYMGAFEAACQGRLQHWEEHHEPLVALLILVDQYPRILFKDTPKSFEFEPIAQDIVLRALDSQILDKMEPKQLFFACVALSHQEDLESQFICLQLWNEMSTHPQMDESLLRFTPVFQRNFQLIEAFKRFPHRNKILDRKSTREERALLKKYAKHQSQNV